MSGGAVVVLVLGLLAVGSWMGLHSAWTSVNARALTYQLRDVERAPAPRHAAPRASLPQVDVEFGVVLVPSLYKPCYSGSNTCD